MIAHWRGRAIGARVHQDHLEIDERVVISVQKQHARLSGDGHANLVRDLQPRASFEANLIEEDLHETMEALHVFARKPLYICNVLSENLVPSGRKGLGGESFMAPFS